MRFGSKSMKHGISERARFSARPFLPLLTGRVRAIPARSGIPVRVFLLGTALVLSLACQPTAPPPTSDEPAKPRPPKLLEGLGEATHPITTDSPRAQRYFDQAMILVFGFNHEAAIRSFEEAARLDPGCAMCHWGIALALGPNINAPMGPEAAARAYREVQTARSLAGSNARESAYIEALAQRYAEDGSGDRAALDLAYANAMREVYQADPQDLDAATLFAESLMDLYPWAYWTAEGAPREHTEELVEVLEAVMESAPSHVGANHYYIHAVEEFFPEKGEPAADRLGSLAPDAGHLVHMPSHIYWRVGRYEDAAEINQRAAESDERYFAWCRPGTLYRALYYPHNVHFLWAAATAEGRRDLALMTARKLEAKTKPGLEQAPAMQEFAAVPMLTLARFGLWDAVLGEPAPDESHLYLTGIWHYTRGLAQARTGALADARASLAQVDALAATPEANELVLAGGVANATKLLGIASATLRAEIARADGNSAEAIRALEVAIEGHDALPYMEPPPWYAPPRQVLGAILLDVGRNQEAEAVYLEDLRQYPKNGWSLFGLAQSLEARGETARAEWAQSGFESAWARADVPLERSHF